MAPLTAQILIVEDKDSLRTMLRHTLERQEHVVLEARDQPEAVRLLQTMQPAVVLSDLRLPEGDGFGVLRAAKEIDADIPVIVMTAYGSIEDAVTAMKEGAGELFRAGQITTNVPLAAMLDTSIIGQVEKARPAWFADLPSAPASC